MEERILAAEAEACGHDDESGADKPERSVPDTCRNLCSRALKEPGDTGSIPGLVRSPGEDNGYPLQYSCLENSMNKGAWQAAIHRIAKNRT